MPGTSLLLLATLALGAGDGTAEVVDDYSWAQVHYKACLQAVLGSKQHERQSPFSRSLSVSASLWTDSCAERQVTLIEEASGQLTAEVVSVQGEPVLEQLHRLHQAHPKTSWEQLCHQIPRREFTLARERAEKLGSQLTAFTKERFPLTPENLASIHGANYMLSIEAGQWKALFEFQDVREPSLRSPIAEWIEETISAAGIGCPQERE